MKHLVLVCCVAASAVACGRGCGGPNPSGDDAGSPSTTEDSGTASNVDGGTPDAAMTSGDGSVTTEDGSVVLPDGGLLVLDGSVDDDGGEVIPDAGPEEILLVRPVDWNPNHVDVGTVHAVAEDGINTVVFSSLGAFVFTSGSLTASDSRISAWRSAATIQGADNAGPWVVGVDAVDGGHHLHRIAALSEIEDITQRYDLLGRQLMSVADVGGGITAIGFVGGFAVADGTHVTTYEDPSFESLVGGAGSVAGAPGDHVRMFSVAMNHAVDFALMGARHAAFDNGKLVVATLRDIYRENNMGVLVRRWTDDAHPIHGLAVADTRVWLVIGGELAVFEQNRVKRTRALGLSPTSTIIAASDGDIWVIDDGNLLRFAVISSDGDEAAWETTILPVFARTCANCHSPASLAAPMTLNDYASWVQCRATIHRRVIEAHDGGVPAGPMPPVTSSTQPTQADLDAIRMWTESVPASDVSPCYLTP